MSSNELSELIAMSCPDLGVMGKSNGSGSSAGNSSHIHIYDEKRRLSVKQMTATELASVRAAAALEIKNVLTKVSEPLQVASAPATPLAENCKSGIFAVSAPATPSATKIATLADNAEKEIKFVGSNSDNENHRNISKESCYQSSCSKSPGETHLESSTKLLPSSPVPRERITSLPSILDEGMEDHLLSLNTNVGLKNSSISIVSNQSGKQLTVSANSLQQEHSDGSNSPKNPNFLQPSSSSSSINNLSVIEMMREQRRNRGNSRERRSDSLLDERRVFNERSVAPDRLNSSSISSVGSAAGGVPSVSLSRSNNDSLHNNNSSEVPTPAKVMAAGNPSIFPLAKTTSAPNMEIRRSSLSALFPGPSPLVAPEPVLHTDPKVDEIYTKEEIEEIVQETLSREIPIGKQVHKTKTPPPVGVKLGVNLKKVTPPRTHITVKKNEGPMLGVVLRKVEKKQVPQKSILEDDKPLYHLSIVRSDGKEHKPSEHHATSKPKPKPVPLQKSATVASKPNPGGILTGPQTNAVKTAYPVPQVPAKPQRPAPGVPITIQKIEGDKIIIIKKYIVPKNSKLPEHLMKVGVRILCIIFSVTILSIVLVCVVL